jgi:Protein of unknown function (DUF2793)
MSDETPRLKLAQLVSMQELNNVTWNEALAQLDVLVDLCLLGQNVNTPPASPADGDAYLLGASPTGAWSGYAWKIAACLDGGWRFYTPFNGLRAYVAPTGAVIVCLNGVWTDMGSLISAAEVSVASAATCDLGAAGSLFVQITGTAAITSFGGGANKLRFVRFAGASTLTHNAASLILLGGANRTTAAGDVGLYASDAAGNWRERAWFSASKNPANVVVTDAGGSIGVKTTNPTADLDVRGGGIIKAGNPDLNGELRSYQNYDGTIVLYVSLRTSDSVTHRSGIFRSNAGFFAYYDTSTGDIGLDAQYTGANVVFQIGSVTKGGLTNAGVLWGNSLRVAVSAPPASANATGTTGTIAWDTNYIYLCTAANTWRRAALVSW